MPFSTIRNFIKLEAASGIVLFVSAIIAMILANSPWQQEFTTLLTKHISISANGTQLTFSLKEFVNEGLMAIFFLLVSLEIKRELLQGELNSIRKAILPLIAAIGGMLLPALIYILFTWQHPHFLRGWAIPTATDIAFSLGILVLLGSRIPSSLKILLTALAIIDDLGAIIIIALFYTDHLILTYLLLAIICILFLVFLNYLAINTFIPYGIIGLLLWFCLLKAGIHTTIAGVVLGFSIPLLISKKTPLLRKVEKTLLPWVTFGIFPLFAIANAGFSLTELHLINILTPISLGIILGLFLGKQLGIFSISWLAIKLKIAKLPSNINWRQLYGMSIICGIGFTMSLFISTLAFAEHETQLHLIIKFSILAASLLSGITGYLVLRKNHSLGD